MLLSLPLPAPLPPIPIKPAFLGVKNFYLEHLLQVLPSKSFESNIHDYQAMQPQETMTEMRYQFISQ